MPKPHQIPAMRRTLTLLLPFLLLVACSELLGSGVAIRSFTVAGDPVEQGVFVLSWRVDGLEGGSLTLAPGPDGGASLDVTAMTSEGEGQVEVSPQADTEYVLTAVSGVTPSQTAEATIKVVVPGAGIILDFSADVHPVNPGIETTLRWQVDNDPELRLTGPGLGADGVDVTGSTSFTVWPVAGADYVLQASSPSGDDEVTLTDVGREVPAASFLIAGQSNAQGRNVPFQEALAYDIPADEGVRMLGNDYVWQDAYEPTDDCTDQVDLVSRDPTKLSEPCNSGVSFGVSFGNRVQNATRGPVFLIPAAKGGSTLSEWQPESNRYYRGSLFGSAAYRAQRAGIERGAPIGYERYGALLWYQGEAETYPSKFSEYATDTDVVFDVFQAELGMPILFAQLGRIYERTTGDYSGDKSEDGRNLLFQAVREAQIGLENDSDAQPRYMVVTHDLPMADRVHLSAPGQIELGRRLSLAFREHVRGETDVDGTGPRVEDVRPGSAQTVEVHYDREISESPTRGPGAYSGYFGVFTSNSELDITSIERVDGDAGSNSAILITFSGDTGGEVVQVRYLPPELPTDQGVGMLVDVVRSASCESAPMPDTGLCLPAPAFGTATGGVSLESLQFEDLDTW